MSRSTEFIESILSQISERGYTCEVTYSGNDDCFTMILAASMPVSNSDSLREQILRLAEENKTLKERLERVETT